MFPVCDNQPSWQIFDRDESGSASLSLKTHSSGSVMKSIKVALHKRLETKYKITRFHSYALSYQENVLRK